MILALKVNVLYFTTDGPYDKDGRALGELRRSGPCLVSSASSQRSRHCVRSQPVAAGHVRVFRPPLRCAGTGCFNGQISEVRGLALWRCGVKE